jgi:hypothetical protein
MKISFIQTADPIFYHSMFENTSKTVRLYCIQNGFSYEGYVGIKRGHMPWQATFNRIYMLKEMVDRGVAGWVFYLDADAYIKDMSFDLRYYLSGKSNRAGIFAGFINDVIYDINAGGFAVNLSHPMGRALVNDYHKAVSEISDEDFNKAIFWDGEIKNDQHLLYIILRHYVEDLGLAEHFLFERTNNSYVNNGPFISQRIRSMFPSFAERVEAIGTEIGSVLTGLGDVRGQDAPGIYIPGLHPRLLTSASVKTAFGICSTGVPGMILYGPYIPLPAGAYQARFYGEIRGGAVERPVQLVSDVARDCGRTIIANLSTWVDRRAKGLLARHDFTLAEASDDVEVRLSVLEPIDLCIHAVQISPLG